MTVSNLLWICPYTGERVIKGTYSDMTAMVFTVKTRPVQ